MRQHRFTSPGLALLIFGLSWSRPAGAQSLPPDLPLRGSVLQPSRAGSFQRRPFNWGRIPERHSRVTRGVGSLPIHPYGLDTPRTSVSAVSFYPPVQNVASLLVAPGNARTPVNFKRFHLQSPRLVTGSLSLEQIGVIVYETGQIAASGRIQSSGGPTGASKGDRAVVEIRAYNADLQNVLSSDATLLWSARREIWIPTGAPETISFLPPSLPGGSAALGSLFDQITHFEVNLQAVAAR